MRLNYLPGLLVGVLSFSVPAQWGGGGPKEYEVGDVISGNTTGTQGDYHVEYWQQNRGETGSMTLGEDGDFSCEWQYNLNILFRKGIRPGSRDLVVVYEADYKPQGNSYLGIYGWFDNPLAEYYIIESWGSWKPPGGASKGSFETDSGTYDIFQNSRTGPSIKGNTTFQQYWSVRRAKRTSGIITCGDHFDAWEDKGMRIGSFYEVSFNVEAYKSPGGQADVKVQIMTEEEYDKYFSTAIDRSSDLNRTGTLSLPVINTHTPVTFYNALGRKMTGMTGVKLPGQHSVMLNEANQASGVYFSITRGR